MRKIVGYAQYNKKLCSPPILVPRPSVVLSRCLSPPGSEVYLTLLLNSRRVVGVFEAGHVP